MIIIVSWKTPGAVFSSLFFSLLFFYSILFFAPQKRERRRIVQSGRSNLPLGIRDPHTAQKPDFFQLSQLPCQTTTTHLYTFLHKGAFLSVGGLNSVLILRKKPRRLGFHTPTTYLRAEKCAPPVSLPIFPPPTN